MARLVTLFMILIALQAAMILYADQTPQSTSLWDFVTNIDNWNSTTFVLTLIGIAAGIGLAGIAASAVFGFKTDFLILAPAIAGLISMGVIFVNLANIIHDELVARVFTSCQATVTCAPVTFILAVTVGPMALYYVWSVVSWWRGSDL